MKVLITGSTGFIGAALCRELVNAGHQVVAFHRPTSMLRLLEDLPVEHAIGDLTQIETLENAMQGVEVVFHTAAMIGTHHEPGQMYAVTVEGTRAVLNSARNAGVSRVVHTSSVAALGVPEPPPHRQAVPVLLDEKHTWNFRHDYWPYGYAKYLAELEVQRAVVHGLDVVIVNPSIVMGAGDIYRQNSSMIVQAARKRFPGVLDGGLNIIHIDDVVQGHLAALECGHTGERYILSGHNITISLLLQKISAITGSTIPQIMFPSGMMQKMAGIASWLQSFIDLPIEASNLHMAGMFFFYNNKKAQIQLGIPAIKPLETAITDAYQWFIKIGAIKEQKIKEVAKTKDLNHQG